LNAAYEILGEEDKRKAFDGGQIDAEGKPRFQGFEGFGRGRRQGGFKPEDVFETFSWGRDGFQHTRGRAGGFGGFEDVLKEAFGGAGRSGQAGGGFRFEQEHRPGQDISAALTITLPEAAKGTDKRVQLPTGREVDVKIPVGVEDGQVISLKGQGLAGSGGRAGDLLITVSVAPHPLFTRNGADLRLELPVTLYEAVLGARVRVPTLDGAVELAIPPGTSSGRTFRLKGKGFPAKQGKGDLLATVRIVLPEGGDSDLEELMRKWRKLKPHDPRQDMG
jgi:DnaJ-class molecular chaperone